MEIPKIIHQTWKDEIIPEQFVDSVNSWKNLHPEWEYRLWTDEMNESFIETYFPDFLETYLNYEKHIQRVDAIRYFILYKFGGVYVDLDFFCFKNIVPLISDSDCVFGVEHSSHSLIHGKEMIISNAIMASVPKAAFTKLICDELLNPSFLSNADKNNTVLETTGPFMLTRLYEKYSNNIELNVKIVEAKYLYPLSKEEVNEELLTNIKNNVISDKLKDAYAVHYYWGSWWK